MRYSVILTLKFKKEARRLIKKYPSLRSELLQLEKELADNPQQGSNLGHNIFKIRLAIKSKSKGKSGGARIITFLLTQEFEIYLLTIYDKSEIETVDDRAMQIIVEEILRQQ